MNGLSILFPAGVLVSGSGRDAATVASCDNEHDSGDKDEASGLEDERIARAFDIVSSLIALFLVSLPPAPKKREAILPRKIPSTQRC